MRKARDNRRLHAAAALMVAAWSLGGCRFPISAQTLYLPEAPLAEPPRAVKQNELRVGIAKLELRGREGEPADPEAGDARDLGRLLAEGLEEARVFAEVHYPLRDEEVDVVLEPTLTVTLAKNRGTNALKVFPGIIVPWIDGMGFDYDHEAVLVVRVRDARGDAGGALCDTLEGKSAMTAERYPSVLWFLGLHAGLLILTVLESTTTNHPVLERLVEHSFARAAHPVVTGLVEEFAPLAKPCPDHPDEQQPGRYCIVDGRDLYYPILARRAAEPAAPQPAAD